MFKRFLAFGSLIIMLLSQAPVAQALSLEEEREYVIEAYMQGITENYSYEEVEAYISSEEAYVLETGDFRFLSTYGMGADHSTGLETILVGYLKGYFDANTDESDLERLYPYQVDFTKLPENLIFYDINQAETTSNFFVRNYKDRLEITSRYDYYDGINGFRKTFSGYLTNKGTYELVVRDPKVDARKVNLNTAIEVFTTAHRREFAFSFFYNQEGGLSLLMQMQESPQDILREYKTLETVEELEAQVVATDPAIDTTTDLSDWALPHDWRMLSKRRLNVPPVAWVMMSIGDGETIAIEPTFSWDGTVSGFINPNHHAEIVVTENHSDKLAQRVEAFPDAIGFFSIDTKSKLESQTQVNIFNENNQLVFSEELPIYDYSPTPLEHESGYLTVERYFADQTYMEGYTYPYAEVTVKHLMGNHGTWDRTVMADATGYFYLDVLAPLSNLHTNVVSIDNPDSDFTVIVVPYPWTQEELDNAVW